MSGILAVTCPSGKQSARLLPLLYRQGRFILRLAAHSQSSAVSLRAKYPKAEVVKTDLQSFADCARLLDGATAVNAILPSLHSHEKEIGFNLVDAAVAEYQRTSSVFKHFVLSSVLGTQHRNLMQHDLKSYVEERLFLSPMDCWTILKPTNFLDAYPVADLARQDAPVLEKWWAPQHANSVIALQDLAEATAKVLNEREKHYLAEYPLCSTMPISEIDIVKIISDRIGKKVVLKTPSFEAGVHRLQSSLFRTTGTKVSSLASEGDSRPDLVRDTVERLILFYNGRGLKGSPNVLRWLLGREPATVEEWVERTLQTAKATTK